MIEKFCCFLIKKMKKEMPEMDEEKAEIINYGLQILIGEIPKIFIILIIAWALRSIKINNYNYINNYAIQNFFWWTSFKNTFTMHFSYNFILFRDRINKQINNLRTNLYKIHINFFYINF